MSDTQKIFRDQETCHTKLIESIMSTKYKWIGGMDTQKSRNVIYGTHLRFTIFMYIYSISKSWYIWTSFM